MDSSISFYCDPISHTEPVRDLERSKNNLMEPPGPPMGSAPPITPNEH